LALMIISFENWRKGRHFLRFSLLTRIAMPMGVVGPAWAGNSTSRASRGQFSYLSFEHSTCQILYWALALPHFWIFGTVTEIAPLEPPLELIVVWYYLSFQHSICKLILLRPLLSAPVSLLGQNCTSCCQTATCQC
jgi:hypothetical protein